MQKAVIDKVELLSKKSVVKTNKIIKQFYGNKEKIIIIHKLDSLPSLQYEFLRQLICPSKGGNIEEISKISKALSEPKRIEITILTSEEEMCANHLLEKFDITQPTLSHHLKQLRDCKLMNVKKDGMKQKIFGYNLQRQKNKKNKKSQNNIKN